MAHKVDEKPRTTDVFVKEEYTFNSLFLPDKILQGLKQSGFHRPSPIQLKAIPLGRCGLDLIVKAKSGTGKTVVFTVLALETIDVSIISPQVIIVAPTREIAVQIEDVIKIVGSCITGLQVGCFIGGLPIENDIKKVQTCHIVIGAPGRLKSLLEKKHLKTKSVRLYVLDEADKLLDASFQADINYIYNNLPLRKQVLAVSATYFDNLDKFLANYMHSPTFVTPEVESPVLLGLQQFVTIVKEHKNIMQQIEIKTNELVRLLSQISFTQCIVFFNFQTRAETLSHMLKQRGWNAMYISGSQPQTERLKVINSLKKFECRVLLTTDLTARGIDASNVNLVINYEVPFKADTYLHRMGRAGRYGSQGVCISIAAEGQELYGLQNILGQIGGSELSVAKVPENLGDIWTCTVNDLEKVEGIVTKNENLDIKQTVVDLKSIYSNLEKLKVGDEIVEAASNDNTPDKAPLDIESDQTTVQSCDKENDFNEDFVSANDLFPWVPIESSIILQPTGENLLEQDLNTFEVSKKRKVEGTTLDDTTKLTLSKNIALYNTARLLTSNALEFNEDLSNSVGEYFNKLQEEDNKQTKQMEKMFESYSCDDILKNLMDSTSPLIKSSEVKPVATESSLKHINKESIFKVSYDFITKNKSHWTEVVSDYCSSDEEVEEEGCDESYLEEESFAEEDDNEYTDSALEVSRNYTWQSEIVDKNKDSYHNVPMFKHLYDQCSQDMYKHAGTFSNEETANAWYDNWRSKLFSVTNYVQQNIETYEKSRYQHSMYFNNN